MYDQAIKRFVFFDLAREARGRLDLEGGVELLFFIRRGRTDDRKPFLINVDKTCGTCAGATAFRDNAGNVVSKRRFRRS